MKSSGNDEVPKLIARAVKYWTERGVVIKPGAPIEIIHDLESRSGFQLPHDLRDFYVTVNGMGEESFDSDAFIRVVGVEELFSTPVEQDRCAGLHAVAEYSLWAHAYGIQLDPGEETGAIFLVLGNSSPILVARSFSEFLRLLLDSPQQLFPARRS